MNIASFILLLKDIYGSKPPDLSAIERKGLLAVKIAQHFALRIDFLDEKVCAHLAQLYRNNAFIPEENVIELINKYRDENWIDRHFNEFDRKPFACASVGQTHFAQLKSGEKVVVKIIKNDFKESLLKDVRTLVRWFKILLKVFPKYQRVFDPIGILNYIQDYTLTEIELGNEISGAGLLKELQDKHNSLYDLSALNFPKYYDDLSNSNILVSQKIEGVTFDELISQGKLSYELLLQLFSIHGFYIFYAGKFHGDLHPGNIMLDRANKIYFIDCAAISEINDKLRFNLFYFMHSLSNYDYDNCIEHLIKMAEKPNGLKDKKAFREDFYKLYKDFEGSSVERVSLTKKMMDTIKLAVNSGLDFEKGMFSVIKSMMYLDGMVLRCKPSAVLMRDMRPYMDSFAKLL